MYKVSINATYFENNLKINQEIKQGLTKSKAKFLLSEQQKQFIQMHLPRGYKFTITTEIDQKRNRTPRKADAQFDTQFFKRDDKRQNLVSERKNQKKQQRRGKQKQQVTPVFEQQQKNKKVEQQFVKQTIPKQQNLTKKMSRNRDPQIEHKKSLEVKNQQSKTENAKIEPVQQKISQKMANESSGHAHRKNNQQPINQNNKQMIKQIQQPKKINLTHQQNNKIKQQQIQPTINTNLENSVPISHQNTNVLLNQASQQQQKVNQITLNSQQKQFCLRFVNKLKTFKSSWPFRLPVDPINQGVPNYLQVIHQPMDLKTIQKKINTNKYEHIAQFYGDINKIFLNSYKFNPKQTNYYTLTCQLEQYYHELLKQYSHNPAVLQYDKPGRLKGKISSKVEQDFVQQQQIVKKSKISSAATLKNIAQASSPPQNLNPITEQKQKQVEIVTKSQKLQNTKLKRKFSDNDRRQLIRKIYKLSSKSLQSLINTIYGEVEDDRTSFQIQFENLSEQLLIKIQNIVKTDLKRCEDSKGNINNQTRMVLF